MRLRSGSHLAYCTNIHPAETWEETFQVLEQFVKPIAANVRLSHPGPFAIGLRLSDTASQELLQAGHLVEFQRWLDGNDFYVFTINGFPFGQFHGARVKENVYRPDWSDPRRLEYTNRLFDILAPLLPEGVEGSVSTLPGSFKGFIKSPEQEREICANLYRCASHIGDLHKRTGKFLHLGLEPEPLGLFENTAETIAFFGRLRELDAFNELIPLHIGVNYDTCHFAVEYEEPGPSLTALADHGIRISKIHLSNALKLQPTGENRRRLAAFADDVYLHQVIRRTEEGTLVRHADLGPALESTEQETTDEEWRVHFHIPLHAMPDGGLANTADHIEGLLRHAEAHPAFCKHFEMETYTWGVLPDAFKSRTVLEQIEAEYNWTLQKFRDQRLA